MSKYLSKKEEEEYLKYVSEKNHGRILTPDGLHLICAGLNYDPEAIGKHFLEILTKFRNENIL